MVANLCEVVGADVTRVALGMGLDPRVGPAFLNPGIGFGGSCFPKDVRAFIRIAEKSGCDFSLLREVEKINQSRVAHFVEKVRKELWVIRGKKVAVWGLAFKPNTDDIRFAPSIEIMKALLAEGAVIRAYEPRSHKKGKISPARCHVLCRRLRGSRRSRRRSAPYRMGGVPEARLESALGSSRDTADHRWEKRSGPRSDSCQWVSLYRNRWCFGHAEGGAVAVEIYCIASSIKLI